MPATVDRLSSNQIESAVASTEQLPETGAAARSARRPMLACLSTWYTTRNRRWRRPVGGASSAPASAEMVWAARHVARRRSLPSRPANEF